MESAIYTGWVQHRRFAPRAHRFRYKVFMVYADLAELDSLCALSPWWSRKPWAPARFCREDFFGDPSLSLDEAVRRRVWEACGERPPGPVRLLANWRYFGYNMNPISIYYCFDDRGRAVHWILLEVRNTPWQERHSYVLDCRSDARVQRAAFAKTFHVSPFMPMAQSYRWRSTTPGKRLSAYLQNIDSSTAGQGERPLFDATLSLRRQEPSPSVLNGVLIQYPLMTVKVITAIYWQAFKLWLRRTPVFAHPRGGRGARTGDKC
ncbi:DUF1365 domain-containing protein [uncultured Microbulbifer sp.]|uniref:DUF1365 domain-containing protein n=1 Tax=uncultured Microbulbifer sp. TaxID=348147 RepID=UPI00260276E7|nr:DUF1365 domain-containing protein [uncultured Microbulbifer sp.]